MAKHRFKYLSDLVVWLVQTQQIAQIHTDPDGKMVEEIEDVIKEVKQRGVVAGRVYPWDQLTEGQQRSMLERGHDPRTTGKPEPTDDPTEPTNYSYLVSLDLIEPRFHRDSDHLFMLMAFENIKRDGLRGSTFVYDDETHVTEVFHSRMH